MVDAVRPHGRARAAGVGLLAAVALLPGCAVVPRERIEESRRLTQSLRAENARLKDQVLVLRNQNRDYADRAVDDLRRLTARDQAIERLERSVQGYQDDRDRLVESYQRLAVGLGRTPDDAAVGSAAVREPSGRNGGPVVRADLRGAGEAETSARQWDPAEDGPPSPPDPGRSSP